jgi:hypothetical protein
VKLRSDSAAFDRPWRSRLSSAGYGGRQSLWAGWLLVTVLLLPIMIAIWTIPGFSTQDGPTHLYNAWILSRSFGLDSPYQAYYQVRWQPLPNWAGHLVLAGLLRIVSPGIADRIMITLTLMAFAVSLVWLRWKVRGGEAFPGSCLLIVILAPNFLWLLGFTSFLLGCCVLPITLGVWWSGRDHLGAGRLVTLAILVVLGYFCHLVTLGLTAAGLGVLALFAPAQDGARMGWESWFRRQGRTAAGLLPLVFLGVLYLRLFRQGGPMNPQWPNLTSPDLLTAWVARLGWVDALTLSKKVALPFTEQTGARFTGFAPVVWLGLAILSFLGGWAADRLTGTRFDDSQSSLDHPGTAQRIAHRHTRSVWWFYGALMLLGGILGPDSLGSWHGEYLPQRLVLLGLAALVPAVDIPLAAYWGRLTAGCLAVAIGLQTVIVWDYAFHCNDTTGQFVAANPLVGRGQRIAPLLTSIRSRFRANPLLHADSWLGVGTGNILWSNYEARYYYFPVQFRPGLDRPDPKDFERLSLTSDPRPGDTCVRLWEQLLSRYARSIDRVVAWKSDPFLSAITRRWYDLVVEHGDIRIYAPRDPR